MKRAIVDTLIGVLFYAVMVVMTIISLFIVGVIFSENFAGLFLGIAYFCALVWVIYDITRK